jgi:phage terminase large subunit-like protein
MGKSLAQTVAELPEEERLKILEGLDPDELIWDWSFWGRPEQTPPKDASWNVGLYLGGRGAGKTRAAAEWIREKARISDQGHMRFLLVARTAADVRDVLVEGDSGVLNVTPPSERPLYEPSKRRLTWPNGNTAVLSTADEPDSLRGVQAHYSWADELAAWRQTPDAAGMTSWDNLRVATRLGMNPQIFATTTPKRVGVLYSLLEEAKESKKVWVSRGSTMDNAVDGALWTDELISAGRQSVVPGGLPLRCIGVDPSVAESPRDECGIVVVSSTAERDLYKRQSWVLEDASVLGSPTVWAQRVVDMARKWGCPVVAEVNQGGALVRNAIHTIDSSITVLEVHSKYGKALRAEPITLAYEQSRVHHVGYFAELESQMTSWVPGEGKSPDRVDALVHALTALLIKPPAGFSGGRITAKSHADRRIPGGPSGAGRGVFRVR